MDEDKLSIVVETVLDVDAEKSKIQIQNKIPELEKALRSGNVRVGITAGLDTETSASTIRAQLNTLFSQADIPSIKINLEIGRESISRIINREFDGIRSASQGVTKEIVNNFNSSFGISVKATKEAKAAIEAALRDITSAWNTNDIEKYNSSMQRLMELVGRSGKQFIDPGIKSQIDDLRKLLSDGSKVYIGEKLREDLQYSLDSANELRAVLTNIYGVGNWTFDRSKGGRSADTLIDPTYADQFHGLSEAIIETDNRIRQLQRNTKGGVIDAMTSQMTDEEIQVFIRDILQLKESMQSLQYIPGIDVFENIDADVRHTSESLNKLNDDVQKTSGALTQLSNKNYFSNNTDLLKNIRLYEQEENAIRDLETVFSQLGATVSSTETRSRNGMTTGFVVSVQSATGEVEKFQYKLKDVNKNVEGAAEDWKFVLQNIKASDSAVQKLAQDQAKYADSIQAAQTKLKSTLDTVKNNAVTGKEPIQFSENLNVQYQKAEQAITALGNADRTVMSSMQANAEAEIAKLQQMAKAAHDAQYAATSLRTKDLDTNKQIAGNKLDEFITKVTNGKVPLEVFQGEIEKLKTSLNSISDSTSLTNFLNQLDIAKSKFSSLDTLYKNISARSADLDKMSEQWEKQGVYTERVKEIVEELRTSLKNVTTADGFKSWTDNYEKQAEELKLLTDNKELNANLDAQIQKTKEILSLQTQIANLEGKKNKETELTALNSSLSARREELNVLQQESTAYENIMSRKQQEEAVTKATAAEAQRLATAQARAADRQAAALENQAVQQQRSIDREAMRNDLVDRGVSNLQAQVAAYESINTRAAKIYKSDFDNLRNGLANARTPEDIAKIRSQFTTLKAEIKAAGNEGKTFFQVIAEGAKKFSAWFSTTTVIMRVVRDIKKMVTTVIELDTAMVDLKKTFTGTQAELDGFYISANDTAKDLGVTTKEIIEQAAAWSRLGYSNADAAETMAKNSAIFKTISPGMDIDTATDGLVSMMKAFDIEANDVLDGIMSKVNIVGNKFATDNDSIVEAMKRSSSAMAEANNSLEETIALNTASIEITRNAETTANAWRTVSMRIRGYDEETQELSDDLVNISGEIADLTKTAGNKFQGISIFTDETRQTYKSTYEIIEDIAEIYNELSDKQQAELLEKIAGKRNAQVVAAAIKNFQTAEDAMDAMADSSGNAMEEMEIAYESIGYKVNEFKETFVGLSQTVMDSDFLKGFISTGTKIIDILDKIIDQFGVLPTLTTAFIGGLSLKNVGE